MQMNQWMVMLGLTVMIARLADEQTHKNPFKKGTSAFLAYNRGVHDFTQAIAKIMDEVKDRANSEEEKPSRKRNK